MTRKKPEQKEIAYRRKTADERRSDLINAGIACLGKGGMNGFTIDLICRQAGVSRGLINHHFRTKEELLVSIYGQMTEYLVQDHEKMSASDQIREFINQSFDETSFRKSNLRAWLAIWGEVATNHELKALHQARYRNYSRNMTKAIKKIAQQENLDIRPERVSRQLIALIDGLWLEYCLHSDGFSLAEAREDCLRFLEGCGVFVGVEV